MRRLAFLLLVTPSAGCGLTADFAGLQGGTRDAGAPVEAGAPVDAAAGFCASRTPQPKLCADFDEGKPVNFGWTLVDVEGGGAVSVGTDAFSPPGAFLSAVAPSVDGLSSGRLQESLPVLASTVHVEFEMRIAPGDSGPFELCAIHQLTNDPTAHGLFYKEENGKLLLYVNSVDADGGTTWAVYPFGPAPSSWLMVEIDVTLGAAGSVTVKHDGVVVMQATNIPTSTEPRAQLFVDLGFYAFQRATARASFDNVVVDWTP